MHRQFLRRVAAQENLSRTNFPFENPRAAEPHAAPAFAAGFLGGTKSAIVHTEAGHKSQLQHLLSRKSRCPPETKFMKMSSHQPKLITAENSPTSTSTTSNAPVALALDRDDQNTSISFLMRGNAFTSMGGVEDDSTDIFTLTRCSPLNDF
jgi:hypothetical protein